MELSTLNTILSSEITLPDINNLAQIIDARKISVSVFADQLFLEVTVCYTYFNDIISMIRAVKKYLKSHGISAKVREIAPTILDDGDLALKITFKVEDHG